MKLLAWFWARGEITEAHPAVTSVLLTRPLHFLDGVRRLRRSELLMRNLRNAPMTNAGVLSGPRSLHHELKSKLCVNIHRTLTPPLVSPELHSPSLGPCKINHLKLVRLVSPMQICLPMSDYLLVTQHR